jgi:hypothetical protein
MAPPIIIDFEASGFGRTSYPIEVGLVDEEGRSWCSLIQPEEGWRHWDESAVDLHGISRDSLVEHGLSCAEVADHLNKALRGKTAYCDGWAHDFVWMSHLFEAAGRTPLFKLEDLRLILSPRQQEQWHEVKDEVVRDSDLSRHRASNDARLIQAAWIRSTGFIAPAIDPGASPSHMG